MRRHGYEPVKSYNPYWDKKGKTFEPAVSFASSIRVLLWLKLLSITFQVNDASISLDRQSRPAAVDYAFNVVSIMEVVYR
jgi:hypothetical protein